MLAAMRRRRDRHASAPSDSFRARFEEGLRARDDGRAAEAIDILTELLREEPEDLRVRCAVLDQLGGVLLDAGEYARAERYFRALTALAPRHEWASVGLFHSLWNQGRIDDAFDEMRRLLLLQGSDEYTRLLLELDAELPPDDDDG
jgi:tetratricopeptide (TPR) repeat protein